MCMKKWLIGIDEAGRGPLAGPVAVGVACVANGFDWSNLAGVDDSKKLTPRHREAVYESAMQLHAEGALFFSVALTSASYIDHYGITKAVARGINHTLLGLHHESGIDPGDSRVLLDGLLRAPKDYVDQTTIIGGDGKEQIIGLASILAKVTRDRYMEQLAKKDIYRAYRFEQHKGYATTLHRSLIKEFGLCDMHRRTFCSKLS